MRRKGNQFTRSRRRLMSSAFARPLLPPGTHVQHHQEGGEGEAGASGWGPAPGEGAADVPDKEEGGYEDDGGDSKSVRLTLMEEVLLLGLKDREVALSPRLPSLLLSSPPSLPSPPLPSLPPSLSLRGGESPLPFFPGLHLLLERLYQLRAAGLHADRTVSARPHRAGEGGHATARPPLQEGGVQEPRPHRGHPAGRGPQAHPRHQPARHRAELDRAAQW